METSRKTRQWSMRIILCAWSIFFSSLFLFAEEQQFYFNAITTENGLSHNRVHAILQDANGFLWIGTSDGLNRYDGTKFKTYYKYDLDINSSFIISLCEDNNGNIWVGTDSGVTIYWVKDDKFVNLNGLCPTETPVRNKVPLIDKDERGNIWMAVNNQGLFSYRPGTGKLENYFVENGIQKLPANITSFYFDQNGTCWLSLYFDNLYFADKRLKKITPYSLSDGSMPYVRDNIVRIIKSPYNSIYVASVNQGVNEINLSLNTIRSVLSNTDKKFIPNHIYLDSNKELWICTTTGIYIYSIATGRITHIEASPGDLFSLSDKEILSMTIDDLGGIWAGTYSNGLNHANYSFMDFEKYYMAGNFSLSGSLVREMVEDKNGNVWIGTEKSGLLRYSLKDNKLEKYTNDRLPEHIFGLCYENDRLWIGSYTGIYRLDIRTNRVKVYSRIDSGSMLRDNKIYKIYRNSLNRILVGTTLGVLTYDEKRDDFIPVDSFDGIFVDDILEDTKGTIWYATYAHGLYKHDAANNVLINYRNDPDDLLSVPCNKILSVFEDSKNRIWVATHGAGFCRLNENGTFTTYDISSGLPNNIIYKITEDNSGCLWITSNNGLIKFSPDAKEWKVYTRGDGLLNNEFNSNSGFKASTGDLFLGSKDGFIKFNPKKFVVNKKVPNIVATDFYIHNKPVKPGMPDSPLECSISQTHRINVLACQNSFGFEFSILNFYSPSNNTLYYKLSGYQDEWQKMAFDRRITFNNLEAGTYFLHVKGVSSDGVWNHDFRPIEITVSPRFYKSPAAVFLYVSVAAIALSLFIYWWRRHTIIQQRKREKIFEKNREIELYNEKINFFSNIAHEIKTPLTLIRTPLENIMNMGHFEKEINEDLNLINLNTRHLSQLINELLDFSRIEKKGFQLSCVELDVVEKIEFLKYNFSNAAKDRNLKVEFTYTPEHIYVFADEQGFIKICNNLLSNALKYAETYIRMEASVVEDKAVISVRNDGLIIPMERRQSIFSPFVQYHDPKNIYTKGFGIGLSLAKSLAELHSGSLVIDDDMTCNNFILTLPVLRTGTGKDASGREDGLPEVQENIQDNCPVVLIVEDNVELLKYIKRKLEPRYQVLTAVDGRAALELVGKKHVDIIVSDISMPVMDGLEMCEQLKKDFDTSHIPIIILSAHSSMQLKINSMEYGADIYMEKPFSLEFLISCIDGLLNKRRHLQDLYKSEVKPSPKQNNLSKRDEEFLLQLDEIILENISDPDFSIEQLAEHLCLSKSTLNRKTKGLLNVTPNDYIRMKRLIMAAGLLEEGSSRVNEICYSVGFGTPSYFIKCFKNYYGVLPTEYRGDSIANEKG